MCPLVPHTPRRKSQCAMPEPAWACLNVNGPVVIAQVQQARPPEKGRRQGAFSRPTPDAHTRTVAGE